MTRAIVSLKSSACVLALLASLTLTAEAARIDAFFQHSCSVASVCDQLCVNLPERSGHTCACKPGYQLHTDGFSCIVSEVAIAPLPTSSEAPYHDLVDEEEKQLQSARGGDDDGEMAGDDERTSEEGNINEEVETDAGDEMEKALSDLGDSKAGNDVMAEQGDEESSLQEADDYSENNDTEMVDTSSSELEEMSGKMVKRGRYDRYRGGRQKGRNQGKGRGKGGRERGKGRRKGKGRGKPRKPYPVLADGIPSVKVNMVLTEETGEETKLGSKYKSCDQLRCMGGGRCIKDAMRGGVRCQCKLGTDGVFCEKDVMVKFPKFIGTGYLAFPVLRGAYKEFTIKMEFRPDTHNGLLMFTGEYPDAQLDFFSISLVDGYAQLRFDCGSGMAEVTTDNMLMLGEWNTLTVHRSGWNAWIQLNDGQQISGRSKGMLSRITFRQDLYLGGYRNTSLIGRRTGMKWGFVGCVRSLTINNKRLDMRKGTFVGDAIRGVDVGECSSHICDAVTCRNGGTCVPDSADTSVCLCPLGTAGDACEVKVDIYVPSFSGTSYLQYIGLRRTVLSYAEVEIVFKPEDRDGMLLYNGYTTDRMGDFISLGLVDGYIEFRFDLGTGPAVIRTQRPVTMNEWHVVRFTRTGRDGSLQVDNESAVSGMSKGAYNQLTLTLDLFIGGHRNFDEVAKNSRLTKAFKGCIQKVVINEKPLKMLDDALTGVNIDNCDHPCAGQPCLNGGRCLPMKATYKCSCPIGFDNANCEERIARYRYRYRFRRELRSAIEVPMFTGRSYLKYTNHDMLKRIKGSTTDILIKIRVTQPDGVIFWTGEREMTTMSDFMAVALHDGFVHVRYNLGSGEVMIPYNGSRLNDHRWHRIHFHRNERVGSLEVDGMTLMEGESPSPLQQLNIGDEIYIGGLPDVIHGSMKRYESGFSGCIAEVTMGTDYRVDLIGDASDGQNVQPCSAA